MLPSALEPMPIDDNNEWALFSMAAMLDRTAGNRYPQLNERAYVRKKDGSGGGAYFWKSHADTSQADLFRCLLGIPEFHDQVAVDVQGGIYTCKFDGRTVLELDVVTPDYKIPALYQGKGVDIDKAWDISRNPLIGYTLDWGELCETAVRHDTIVGTPVTVHLADPSFMIPSIALDPGQGATPIFAAYEPQTPFNIELPPRPVGGWCRLLFKLFYPWRP
jgi:hypothetical protein